jgi:molybdopterin converting factor small subunit
MTVEVIYHGILGDIAGIKGEKFEKVNTVDKLKKALYARYTKIKDFIFIMAVNGSVTGDDMELKNGDIIDIIPPMPGG